MAGLVIGLVIVLVLAGVIAVLIFRDIEKRKRIVAERDAEEARKMVKEAQEAVEEAKKTLSPDSETQGLLQGAKDIDAGSDKILGAVLSPIYSNPEAAEAVVARLNLLNARLVNLDARLRRKEVNKRASLEEQVRQAGERVKRLQLWESPKEEVDKAQEEFDELLKQCKST